MNDMMNYHVCHSSGATSDFALRFAMTNGNAAHFMHTSKRFNSPSPDMLLSQNGE